MASITKPVGTHAGRSYLPRRRTNSRAPIATIMALQAGGFIAFLVGLYGFAATNAPAIATALTSGAR